MTDIMVRLEQRYEQTAEPECDLIQEAALVIDRLRDELADVRADVAQLRGEIARLRAQRHDLLLTMAENILRIERMQEMLTRRALEQKP